MKDLRKKPRSSFESKTPHFALPSGKSPMQWGKSNDFVPAAKTTQARQSLAEPIVLPNLALTTLTGNFARLQPSSGRARPRMMKRSPTEDVQCLSARWRRQRHNRRSIALLRREASSWDLLP